MSELLKINVNEHTEKKNGLTYLSWAWAWAEVLKVDPQARWVVEELEPGKPVCFLPDGSALVAVAVTIKGDKKSCVLPVMDHRNKAIKNPDAFAVNTAMMRCLAKAIAMHGLGLYIYAGEDLPEGEPEAIKSVGVGHTGYEQGMSYLDAMGGEEQAWIRGIAVRVSKGCQDGIIQTTYDFIQQQGLDTEQQIALNALLDSKVRSALKAEKQRRQPAKEAA